MKDKDYIKELFSEKLSHHEVPVRSDLWSSIQSQLGNTATTAAAAKGISVATKWAIGIASSVVVAGSVAWFASSDGTNPPETKTQLSSTEKNQPVSTPETEKPVAVSGYYNEPKVSADVKALKVDGGVVNNQEKITVNESETAVPLILKQRQEEAVNTTGTPAPATSGNGAAGSSGASRNATSSSVSGETAQASRPVVGKIKWVNVFTPNNDKDNDMLELENDHLKDFSITVFNEKMQPVYTSSDPDFKWDGTYHQEPLPAGTYGYMVIATDTNGNVIKEFKSLTIMK